MSFNMNFLHKLSQFLWKSIIWIAVPFFFPSRLVYLNFKFCVNLHEIQSNVLVHTLCLVRFSILPLFDAFCSENEHTHTSKEMDACCVHLQNAFSKLNYHNQWMDGFFPVIIIEKHIFQSVSIIIIYIHVNCISRKTYYEILNDGHVHTWNMLTQQHAQRGYM